MGIRQFYFGLLSADTNLNLLGINADTLYPNGAPDSPTSPVFATLRWGPETNQGLNRAARGHDVSLWVYDVDADYTRIRAILKRFCDVMETTPGQPTGDGFIIGLDWGGSGEDGYDDIYQRFTRPASYTIIASGE